jgi:hypothetical protein
MTRCKYCRVEAGRVAYIVDQDSGEVRCFSVHECRDRMRDHERRVVRVFWRVRWPGLTDEYDIRPSAALLRRRERKADMPPHYKVSRVTVRRKAKP